MATMNPTFAFEGDRVIAFDGNQVVASGVDFDKVSSEAEEYFDSRRAEHHDQTAEKVRASATHIETPNGDKGTILGRTAGLWADEITVRFANGQIRRYATYAGDSLKYSTETVDTPASPVEALKQGIEEIAEPTRTGLTARLNALDGIRQDAIRLAQVSSSYTDIHEFHQIVLAADAERSEVQEALEHLTAADMEAIAPPTQSYSAVEQADLGRSDSWLDVVASQMIAESEAQDYDKLLTEGPTLFVSSLDTAALSNTGVVTEMARNHIVAHTAGFQGEAVEQYRERFVAATEMARRQEFAYRQDVTKQAVQKEAKQLDDVPDESLFM